MTSSSTSGTHQRRSGFGGPQLWSTGEDASGSSGSWDQSCTGNGDHCWFSAWDMAAILPNRGSR
jgi:hypothetical protein